ncbi:MAG: DPP IV N-terminal domain-containing protein [Candidatus Marinimicrobia bacterium]|nr:DPP IV N-terminal domain-containing protein [Candidatus Neomarinimicrobiota bacterium]
MNKFKSVLTFLTLILVFAGHAHGQFGKNKIQYKEMDWSFIQTEHFDVYFYKGGKNVASFAGAVSERAYSTIAYQLNWDLTKRISIIIYNSHNDFQQTNVTLEYLYEGIGGFTELFKNRVVIPFEGSYEQFRHVLHHELTHAVLNDMLYGGNVQSLVSGRVRVEMPLWLSEGYAEYSSLDWDSNTDMIIRDAAINGQLPPIRALDYYMAYKGGQSVLRFIGETYGVQRIGEIFHTLKRQKTIDKTMKHTLGVDLKGLTEKWHFQIRKEYWPDIEGRSILKDIARPMTDHVELENYFNVSPAISPDGGRIAFLSDRSGYADIYLISSEDGREVTRIVSGQRTPDLEELKWLSPGISWSPDSRKLVFASKAGDNDALVIYDTQTDKKKIIKSNLDGIFTAAWSPTSDKIAFSGLYKGAIDLYIYDLNTKELRQLTSDFYRDNDPAWSPDGKTLAFVSDRNDHLNPTEERPDEVSTNARLLEHPYQHTDIFTIDVETRAIVRITNTPRDEDSPEFASTAPFLAYTSDRSGIWNIYLYNLETGEEYPITNVLTGVFQLSWGDDDSRLVFAGYEQGGWDIYEISNPLDLSALPEPPRSNFLKREDLQIDVTYSDLPKLEQHRINSDPYSRYIFSPQFESKLQPTDTTRIDSILGKNLSYQDSTGTYVVHPYKTRFTIDLVDARAGYDNFFGFQGNALMVFSDILGNHRIQFGFELYKNLSNSDLLLGYDYLAKRNNYHLLAFHFPDDYWWTWPSLRVRNYGISAGISHPFSKFQRIEMGLTWFNINQEYYIYDDYGQYLPLSDSTISTVLPQFSWIFDNVLYGYYYPIDGWRINLGALFSPNFITSDREFATVSMDARRYFKIGNDYSFAFRLSGASSHGAHPQNFYVGGVANWLNGAYAYRNIPNDYDYTDSYFSRWIFPVRGADYFQLWGQHYALFNAEFRFPFIQYLIFKWPLPIGFNDVRGLVYLDYAKTWQNSPSDGKVHDKLFSGANDFLSSGVGMRINLGYFILRYDLAYDLSNATLFSKPQHIFSLGIDF